MSAKLTTARDITAVMRDLYPAPVRLSVVATSPRAGYFRLKLPVAPGTRLSHDWLADYLTRHLGGPVSVRSERLIRRRDGGRDVEYILRAASALPISHAGRCVAAPEGCGERTRLVGGTAVLFHRPRCPVDAADVAREAAREASLEARHA